MTNPKESDHPTTLYPSPPEKDVIAEYFRIRESEIKRERECAEYYDQMRRGQS